MPITVNDILLIAPGNEVTFKCKDGAEIHSTRSLIDYIKRCRMPEGVSGYKTKADYTSTEISVTAIGKHL